MSLINDMLRDLAEREPRSAHSAAGIAVVPKAPGHRKASPARTAWRVGVILILLGASAWVVMRVLQAPVPPRDRVAGPVPPPPLHPRPRRPVAAELRAPLVLSTGSQSPHRGMPSKLRPALAPAPTRVTVASVRIDTHPRAVPLTESRQSVPLPPPHRTSSIEIAPTRPATRAHELARDLASADRATHRGDWREATRELTHALSLDPDLVSARWALVQLDLAHGRRASAQALLVQMIRLPVVKTTSRETALNWLARTGDAPVAWLMSRHYAPHPLREHPHYLTIEAALAQATRHWHTARGLYRRMTILQPDNAWAWAGLGIALDQLGEGRQALRADHKAITLGNLTPELTRYLGRRIHALRETALTHEPHSHP